MKTVAKIVLAPFGRIALMYDNNAPEQCCPIVLEFLDYGYSARLPLEARSAAFRYLLEEGFIEEAEEKVQKNSANFHFDE